ncbi:general substrate transporter [Basidiobolus meristosporus CBS 931.73]|uniref:General substrate transporter n=1 Tax=Basidiobolus meristosporus CBS 931.73 TaxID=1314790 RepID=A0A1Y1XUR4_9FUNG|nr:general substrate transporter [Basidiobolus meristosporus CBS 931.73]|eukprot:ORX89517.1 general substrate transporter [Basidiobolus meristosporus CBS 931.73]
MSAKESKERVWTSGVDPEHSSSESWQLDSSNAGPTSYVLFSCASATIITFEFGWNVGVPNNSEKILRYCENNGTGTLPDCLPMGDLLWGFATGVFAIGGLVGSFFAGPIADKVGRKQALFWNNLFLIVGGLFLAFSVNTPMFIIGRFIVGIGCGVGSTVTPMYNNEVSPVRIRGAMGALVQVFMCLGIMVSQALGLVLSIVPSWRILYGLTIVPAVLQMVLLLFCPETPRYLLAEDRGEQAKSTLAKLRSGYNVEKEFDMMKSNVSEFHSQHKEASLHNRIHDILRDPFIRRMLVISCVVHAAQQLCGINGVNFYSTTILTETAGADVASKITVAISAFNTFVNAAVSLLVDRLGRKPLFIVSSSCMCLFSVLLVIALNLSIDGLTIASVVCFAGSFGLGLGTVPFMIVPELVPTWSSGVVVSCATTVNWICNFIIGFIFPSLISGLQNYTFVIFAALNLVFTTFGILFVPETRGKSIADLAKSNKR